jgi:spore maturation protein CgeB
VRFVVLGLSITSSWGNGHATTYRALLGALRRAGHETLFLERDRPWYAENRDAPGAGELYGSLKEVRERWADDVRDADVVVVGSYVPEGVAVADWALDTARGVTAFYDIDTPVTLAKLARRDEEYLAPRLVPRFDLYLSFTGGPTLRRLERDWGARRARALYCAVDADRYAPLDLQPRYDLGYLGTYSDDRQPTVERLLLEPARRLPHARFAVAGPQYPEEIEWAANVERVEHLPPRDHPEFYAAQRFTLNVTRADMVRAGWSPSVRLFEAAACGVPAISDWWQGLDSFFRPGSEILVARRAVDVVAALRRDDAPEIGERARRRVLAEHTADRRAEELEALVGELAGAWAA